METYAEKLRRSTTDNRSLALQIEAKQTCTDREEKRIKTLEENSSLRENLCNSGKQQLEELKELREASAKAEADKIREIFGTGEILGKDAKDAEETGSEESLKDRELNLRRQRHAKGGRVKQKAYDMEADKIKRASGQEMKDDELYRGSPKSSSGSSQGPHMTKEKIRETSTLPVGTWQDASEFLIHTLMEMPWDIICVREVCRKTDGLHCGANNVLF